MKIKGQCPRCKGQMVYGYPDEEPYCLQCSYKESKVPPMAKGSPLMVGSRKS